MIDYVCTWGPAILGHAFPAIVDGVRDAATRGTSFGANRLEVTMARPIKAAVPSVEKVRLCNSGTEACMSSAIRLARGFTRRDKIVKFDGCYHGHADGLLVRAGSGATTFGVPDSPGVPKSYAQETITLPFNDRETLKRVINTEGRSIASVIIEPVVANIGCVLPKPGFLETLRELTSRHVIVLLMR